MWRNRFTGLLLLLNFFHWWRKTVGCVGFREEPCWGTDIFRSELFLGVTPDLLHQDLPAAEELKCRFFPMNSPVGVSIRCSRNTSMRHLKTFGASQVLLMVKNLPARAGDMGNADSVPGWEDPLDEGRGTHSSILAWKISWTEEPGRVYIVHVVAESWTRLSGHAKPPSLLTSPTRVVLLLHLMNLLWHIVFIQPVMVYSWWWAFCGFG